MKHISMYGLMALAAVAAWGQDNPYNPGNPPDPQPAHRLTVKAEPVEMGTVSPTGSQAVLDGQGVSCQANPQVWATFQAWTVGADTVSRDQYYYFEMPSSDVEVVAHFVRRTDYNPSNPADPWADGFRHNVTVKAIPENAGRFNTSSFSMFEGEQTDIYAYANSSFRFDAWVDGDEVLSTSNPLRIAMVDHDITYTARFVYEPQDPANPGSNSWNAETGQVVADDFTPGNLNGCLNNLVSDAGAVQSITVIGQMTSNDFGFYYYYPNLTDLDMMRTTGYDQVPWGAFGSCGMMSRLWLPASVTYIENYAFDGCGSLSELTLLATTPPSLGYASLQGLPQSLVVKVPALSVARYQNADGWKDFTILPLESQVSTVTVSLPADGADGRYVNTTLTLTDASSQRQVRQKVGDALDYVFYNVVRGAGYEAAVATASGQSLGSMPLTVDAEADNTAVAFASLLRPCTLTARVVDAQGADVAGDCSITWTDDYGVNLGAGPRLGTVQGSNVRCLVSLPQSIITDYVAPEMATATAGADGAQTLEIRLARQPQMTVAGTVADEGGAPLSGVALTLSQRVNGRDRSATAMSAADGTFSIAALGVAGTLKASLSGYATASLDVQPDAAEPLQVTMNRMRGTQIALTATYRTVDGEGELDGADASYAVAGDWGEYALGSGMVQLAQLLQAGTQVPVQVSSLSGRFAPATAVAEIGADGNGEARFDIAEYGTLAATLPAATQGQRVAMLYDADGDLRATADYADGRAEFALLPDGDYTVVTMERDALYNGTSQLAALDRMGLVAGTDYDSQNVSVAAAQTALVALADAPAIAPRDIELLEADGSYFMPNKTEQVVGNYVTIKGKMALTGRAQQGLWDLCMTVDLPAGCELVQGSPISDSGMVQYYLNGRTLTLYARQGETVRFCVAPTAEGEMRLSAQAVANVDGQNVVQPLGTAMFAATALSLKAPELVWQTKVRLSGAGHGDCDITLYDGDAELATTRTRADGTWLADVELPYAWRSSVHTLHGVLTDKAGNKLPTQRARVVYDPEALQLSWTQMIHSGQSVKFDADQRTTAPLSYTWNGKSDYTLSGAWHRADAQALDGATFVVLCTDGSRMSFPARFDAASGAYYATADLGSRLLANVTMGATHVAPVTLYDPERAASQQQTLGAIAEDMARMVANGQVEQTASDDTGITLSVKPEGEANPLTARLQTADPAELAARYPEATTMEGTTYRVALDVTDTSDLTMAVWNDAHGATLSLTEARPQGAQRRILPALLAGNGLVRSALDFWTRTREAKFWDDQVAMTAGDYARAVADVKWMITATCGDGSYKILDKGARDTFDGDALKLRAECDSMLRQLTAAVAVARVAGACDVALRYGAGQLAALAASPLWNQFVASRADAQWLQEAAALVKKAADVEKTTAFVRHLAGNFAGLAALPDMARNVILSGLEDGDFDKALCDQVLEQKTRVHGRTLALERAIRANWRQCGGGGYGPKADFLCPNVTPVIDPSGYVYEATEDNRLEGVQATVYYKDAVEDMYGVVEEREHVWDAEAYGQANPQYTDKEGMYGWDVPQGTWQVRFQKEGYQDARSEWLPVPPPQLEVNIGMVRLDRPQVAAARAYPQAVEVEFDTDVDTQTLGAATVTVSDGGQTVAGTLTGLDKALARRVRFEADQPFASKTVTLMVGGEVESYASVPMGEAYVQDLAVKREMTSVAIEDPEQVPWGGQSQVVVTVLPALASESHEIEARSLSPMVASVVDATTIDAEGHSVVTIEGLAPGSADLAVAVPGTSLQATALLTVVPVNDGVAATPYSSVPDGSTVDAGTEVWLLSDTPGAVIRYTLDGSCPCDQTGVVKVFDPAHPIVVDRDMEIRAQASAEGKDDSDVAVFTYSVSATGIGAATASASEIVVTGDRVACSGAASISVYDAAAALRARATAQSVDISALPAGAYVAVATLPDGRQVRKFIR